MIVKRNYYQLKEISTPNNIKYNNEVKELYSLYINIIPILIQDGRQLQQQFSGLSLHKREQNADFRFKIVFIAFSLTHTRTFLLKYSTDIILKPCRFFWAIAILFQGVMNGWEDGLAHRGTNILFTFLFCVVQKQG